MSREKADKVLAVLVIYMCLRKKRKKKRKREWMKEWLHSRYNQRHVQLLSTMELAAPEDSKNYLRMDSETYAELLAVVCPFIKKQNTHFREAITPNERLSATLRFLTSGQSFEDLKFLTCISAQSLGKIVMETCEAIINCLKEFIKIPQNAKEWKEIAYDFEKNWNFNNCIGAIDGKHVHIKKPFKSGSNYFNYKKAFSIVMMVLVNADYEFMAVEVGTNGRVSDAGVFSQSELMHRYKEELLYLPQPEKLPLSEETFPYVFVGNDAFPLLENLMTPYSRTKLTIEQQIFNYRLSGARRVVENAFGILCSRFRILHTNINLAPEKAALIVTTCCYLHNFLKNRNEFVYLRHSEKIDTTSQTNLMELEPLKANNSTDNGTNIRDNFCNYFNTLGEIPWQNKFK